MRSVRLNRFVEILNRFILLSLKWGPGFPGNPMVKTPLPVQGLQVLILGWGTKILHAAWPISK